MKVVLELQGQRSNIKRVTVRHDIVIGRATECNLRVSSPQVSRRHCFLRVTQGGVTITDLESSNGTWLNGEKIVAGKRYPVDNGMTLNVGPVQFVAHLTVNTTNNPAHGGLIHLDDEPAIPPSLVDSASMDFSIEHAGPSAEEDEPTVDYSSGYHPAQPVVAEEFAEAVEIVDVEPIEVVDESDFADEAIDVDVIDVDAVESGELRGDPDDPTHFAVVEERDVVDFLDSSEDLLILDDVENAHDINADDVIELAEADIELVNDEEQLNDEELLDDMNADDGPSRPDSVIDVDSEWFQMDDQHQQPVDAELQKFLKGQ